MEGRSDEREQVQALAREFAEAELRPHVERWDRERGLDDAIVEQLAELGFFGMLVPEADGGLGFDLATHLAVVEALAWAEPAVALTLSIHGAYGAGLVRWHGTPEQRERWLGELAAGRTLACLALAEDEAGPELAGISTLAERDGDGWLLSGTKRWVANGGRAGLAVVAARTRGAGAGEAASPGVFLVPADTEGYEVAGRETTMGLRPLELARVRLRGVRVGADALLGGGAAAGAQLSEAVDTARLGVAAAAVGIGQAALDYAVAYADTREQFGERLRAFEGIRHKLADMAAGVAAGRAMVESAAISPSRRAAAEAKVVASEAAMRVATQAVQVYGGYGYMRDYPVEKLMRDAKAMELWEGTNERLRSVIAEELYR